MTDARAAAARLDGKLEAARVQLRAARAELGVPLYERIEERFGEQQVRLHVAAKAVEDLERYHKALDQALIRFHAAKMAEINKIIRELWQKTYKGNDIDTLEIRSNEEGASSARRQYDYRVVMLKGDVDVDMRGRCSAGQKVLASIVIRLALAETFCLHCGILALDEPTTNLDRVNIESLANALCELIRDRAAQSNFQLIVITHDEEFVNQIGSAEYADYAWRVSKDVNGNSRINRTPIHRL